MSATSTVQHAIDKLQTQFKAWVNEITQNEEQLNSPAGALKKNAALAMITKLVGMSIPFATRNHFKVVDFRPGYVKASIPFKPNKNHFNAMYAGALFTVAELPGGILQIFSFEEDFFPILEKMEIEFLKKAKTDVTVEFSLSKEEIARIGEEVHRDGKSRFTLQGEIKDKKNEVVAKTLAFYQVRANN